MAHSPEVALPGIVSSQAEQDDTHLVTASQQGDQHAFAFLVQRHQRRVFNLVVRMLQDYDEASEITQETFLAAWMGLPSFRGKARFATWLYRIAYHCALKQLERRKRERSLRAAIEAEQIVEEANKQKQAEDILELRAQQAIVREQLEKLPTGYRSVLILRHFHEMTYEEMADILTMPIGTAPARPSVTYAVMKRKGETRRSGEKSRKCITSTLQKLSLRKSFIFDWKHEASQEKALPCPMQERYFSLDVDISCLLRCAL